MKKCILFLIVCIGLVLPIFSQFTTISYDLERNYFNEGQPLPSEKSLMFSGIVPDDVKVIEITILPGKARGDRDMLYRTSWIDVDNNTNTNFSLAINYQLRSSEKYDFRIDYFSAINEADQEALGSMITNRIKAYLETYILIKGRQIDLAKSEKKMAAEMENIVAEALAEYRTRDGQQFVGFSETIEQALANLGKMAFEKKDSTVNQNETRRNAVDQQIARLQGIVDAEVMQIMHNEWNKQVISRYVDDQETEKKKGTFSINAGYGGVYLDGNLDNFTYGSSPYLGLSFPLANSTLAPKFLRNSSLTIGAFLQNFEDEDDNNITGFVVGRPIYLGLDYKLFEFIRFNAGATFLEKEEINNSIGENKVISSLLVRPFIGLSAKVDLSVGLGK